MGSWILNLCYWWSTVVAFLSLDSLKTVLGSILELKTSTSMKSMIKWRSNFFYIYINSNSSQSLLHCIWWDPVIKTKGTSASRRKLRVKNLFYFKKIMTFWYPYQFDPTGLILTKVIELTTPDIYYYKLIIITRDCNFTSMSFSYVYVLAFYFISFGEKSVKNLTIKRKEKNSDKRRRVIIYYRNYLSDAFSSPPPLPPFPDIMKLKCC